MAVWPRVYALHRFAIHEYGDDLAAVARCAVAGEGRARQGLYELGPCLFLLLAHKHVGMTRLLLLALHGALKTRPIDVQTPLARHLFGKLEREAMRIVEPKGQLARHLMSTLTLQLVELLCEELQANAQRLTKTCLLSAQCLHNGVATLGQLNVVPLHQVDNRVGSPCQKRPLQTEQLAMTHRAPQHASKDVATPGVVWLHT